MMNVSAASSNVTNKIKEQARNSHRYFCAANPEGMSLKLITGHEVYLIV